MCKGDRRVGYYCDELEVMVLCCIDGGSLAFVDMNENGVSLCGCWFVEG